MLLQNFIVVASLNSSGRYPYGVLHVADTSTRT